mmetsp:Transcript_3440/g.7771  ORF Transcript_3440/g.7771 Transcript_3440/m.7771 type:complete len:90 (+) Transcript_3440:100-369(+)
MSRTYSDTARVAMLRCVITCQDFDERFAERNSSKHIESPPSAVRARPSCPEEEEESPRDGAAFDRVEIFSGCARDAFGAQQQEPGDLVG